MRDDRGLETSTPPAQATRTLLEFERLRTLLIDASSIIYTVKAGCFEDLADCLDLYCPARILEEAGYQDLKIRPLIIGQPALSADESLVWWARRLNWPVLTEDLGVIRQLAKQRTPYFNALIMLEFLFFKSQIGPDQYADCLRRLLENAWYGPNIVRFGEVLHCVVLENG